MGGFWDIGDTHVSVPWDQVKFGDDSALTVPVNEDNVDDFSIFGDEFAPQTADEVTAVDDDLTAGNSAFKATEIIGDYAYLTGGERYGYVSDVLLHADGIEAVVVDAAAYGTPGYYAYPYNTYGEPTQGADGEMNRPTTGRGAWRYDVGYGADGITVIETFDYQQMQNGGSGGGASTSDG